MQLAEAFCSACRRGASVDIICVTTGDCLCAWRGAGVFSREQPPRARGIRGACNLQMHETSVQAAHACTLPAAAAQGFNDSKSNPRRRRGYALNALVIHFLIGAASGQSLAELCWHCNCLRYVCGGRAIVTQPNATCNNILQCGPPRRVLNCVCFCARRSADVIPHELLPRMVRT